MTQFIDSVFIPGIGKGKDGDKEGMFLLYTPDTLEPVLLVTVEEMNLTEIVAETDDKVGHSRRRKAAALKKKNRYEESVVNRIK
jgi:hypothetical protein